MRKLILFLLLALAGSLVGQLIINITETLATHRRAEVQARDKVEAYLRLNKL